MSIRSRAQESCLGSLYNHDPSQYIPLSDILFFFVAPQAGVIMVYELIDTPWIKWGVLGLFWLTSAMVIYIMFALNYVQVTN